MQNPQVLEVSSTKSLHLYGFSIATFDYRRVHHLILSQNDPNMINPYETT